MQSQDKLGSHQQYLSGILKLAKRFKELNCRKMQEAFLLVQSAQIANILQLLTNIMIIMLVFMKLRLEKYFTKKRVDLILFLICVLLSNSININFGQLELSI